MIFLKEDWKSLPWMLEWFRATPGFYRSGIDTDLIWQCKQTAWSKEGRNPPLYWCATLDKNSWPRSQAYLKYTLSRIGKKTCQKLEVGLSLMLNPLTLCYVQRKWQYIEKVPAIYIDTQSVVSKWINKDYGKHATSFTIIAATVPRTPSSTDCTYVCSESKNANRSKVRTSSVLL